MRQQVDLLREWRESGGDLPRDLVFSISASMCSDSASSSAIVLFTASEAFATSVGAMGGAMSGAGPTGGIGVAGSAPRLNT
jgi:hypothetical protein